jgi:putative NADH-flavin reductase
LTALKTITEKTPHIDYFWKVMISGNPLRVGVIGPAGFGGSYLCVELLNRGHFVTGISRNPEKLGRHERYTTRSVNFDTISISDLVKTFEGVDVLVSEYGPHTKGAMALLYSRHH